MGKVINPPAVSVGGRYYIAWHSCGAACRYFTLSDLSSGRESAAPSIFSNKGIEPMRDEWGRAVVVDINSRPDGFLIQVKYHVDSMDGHPEDCTERYYVLNKGGSKIRAVTSTLRGCKMMKQSIVYGAKPERRVQNSGAAMRIICFIVCSSLFLFGNAVFAEGLDELTNFPGSSIQIRTRCEEAGGGLNCKIYSSGVSGEKKLLEFPSAPAYISINSGVFVIAMPCGTQCSVTYFYSEDRGLGGPFPFVEAYDVERGVVLLSLKNPLPMHRMFSKNWRVVGKITLDIPKNAPEIFGFIKDAKVDNHRFLITYVDSHGNTVAIDRPVPMVRR